MTVLLKGFSAWPACHFTFPLCPLGKAQPTGRWDGTADASHTAEEEGLDFRVWLLPPWAWWHPGDVPKEVTQEALTFSPLGFPRT